MAVRHRLISAPVQEVWDVLADGHRYGEWVLGPSHSRPKTGEWPRLGAEIEYTIPLGPWSLSGHTIVRYCDPPHRLELEADSGRLGTARIGFDVRPWGEETLLLVEEHPLRGPGGALHNAAVDAVVQLRHRGMLARLARIVENALPDGPVTDAVTDAVTGAVSDAVSGGRSSGGSPPGEGSGPCRTPS